MTLLTESRQIGKEIMAEILNKIDGMDLDWDNEKFDSLHFINDFLNEQKDLIKKSRRVKNFSQIKMDVENLQL